MIRIRPLRGSYTSSLKVRFEAQRDHCSRACRVGLSTTYLYDLSETAPKPRGLLRPTRASQEIPIHGVDETCLIFVWGDDCHLLPRFKVLFRFILQRLGESIAPYSIQR